MNKTFKVALHEYKKQVLKARFWIFLLAFPLGILLIMAISTILSVTAIDKTPIGYVDQNNLIKIAPVNKDNRGLFSFDVPLLPYANEAAARQAVAEKITQGYFVIPPDYEESLQLNYYSDKPLSEDAQTKIRNLMRKNLLADVPADRLVRMEEGSELKMVSMDGSRNIDENGPIKVFMPVIIGVIFVVIILMSSSYLLQGVVEEKENRTMEVMITSLSPNQLMTGKILGNMAIGLTQMLFWVLIVGVALVIFKDRIGFLQGLEISWGTLFLSMLMMLPSFVFVSALMATLGATVTDAQESQQVSGMVIMPIVLPFYFFAVFMLNPNGLIPKVLTYFPLTSPVSTSLRMAFTNLPAWEVALIYGIQILFAIFAIWLAGKAFRMGMLQYNRRIKIKELFQKEASRG